MNGRAVADSYQDLHRFDTSDELNRRIDGVVNGVHLPFPQDDAVGKEGKTRARAGVNPDHKLLRRCLELT